MASFSDRPLQPFNPYVQQQPVEAMAQIGMQKQQQYNQGVEKIQTSIDNIAGLDIMRDVDKNYLQSQLNDLGTNLKSVAAGDFSNNQLVTSVSGMAKKIGKDSNIQNAVGSTMKARKELASMEKDRSEGKLTPDNEYNFNKGFGEWYNNKEVGTTFNGSYKPHYDIDKHIRETFAALKPDGYTIDQIFQTDETGNLVYETSTDKRTGQVRKTPILSTTMSELKKKGMFPEKVSQTLEQVFTHPAVSQQLQITGEYNYRGYTPENLINKTTQIRDGEVSQYDDRIAELNIRKASLTTEEDKKTLQEQIDKLSISRNNINSYYSDILNTLPTNPDAVRGILYKKEAKSNYLSMYTNIEEERTMKENPAWRASFDMQKEANDLAIRREDIRIKQATLKQADEHFNLKLRADLLAADKKNTVDNGLPTEGAVPSDIEYMNMWEEKGTKAAVVFTRAVDDLIFSSGVLSSKDVDALRNKFPGLSIEEARKRLIDNTAKAKGESPESFRTRWHKKALVYLNQNPQKIDKTLVSKLNSAENAEKVFSSYMNEKSIVDAQTPEQDATKNLGNLAVTITAPWNILRGGGEQRKLILTPELQYDIALAYGESGLTQTKDMQDASISAQKRLEARGLSQKDVNTITTAIQFKASSQSPQKNINKRTKEEEEFFNLLRGVKKPSTTKSYEKRAEIVKGFYQFNPVLEKNFITGESKIDTKNRDALAGIITKYTNAAQNESPNFIDNAPLMHKVALDSEKGSIKVQTIKDEVTGEIKPKIIFSDAKGKNVGEMTITPEEAYAVGYDVSGWYKRPIVKIAEQQMAVFKNGTTARGDVKDPYTYQTNDNIYSKSDFPQLQGIPQDVRGNIAEETRVARDGNPYTVYVNYLYVNDDGKYFVKTLGTPRATMDEALQLFDNQTPQMIQQLISEQK